MLNILGKKYLGIDISDSYVRAYATNGEIVVEENIGGICGVDCSNVSAKWENMADIIKVIQYCLSKWPKNLFGVNVLLAVPPEYNHINRAALLKESVSKVKNLKSLVLVDNIIAAAAGANSDDTTILGPNIVSKKLYAISKEAETYIALIWAGALVDFVKVEKGYDDIEENDILNGLNCLIQNLPFDIPDKFIQIPGMKPFLDEWKADLVRELYISIPSLKQFSLGRKIGEFNALYTKYSNTLIIDGLVTIGKGIVKG